MSRPSRMQIRAKAGSVPVIVAAASVAVMIGVPIDALSSLPGFPPLSEAHGVAGYDMSSVAEWRQAQRIAMPAGVTKGAAA